MYSSVTSWSSTISMSFLYRNLSSIRLGVSVDIPLMLTVAILYIYGMVVVFNSGLPYLLYVLFNTPFLAPRLFTERHSLPPHT
jgi:hypothetical protein